MQLLVWRTLANMLLKPIEEVPVLFERVSFNRATILVPNQESKFYINILIKTGNFEIFESGALVTSGSVKLLCNNETEFESSESNSESAIIEKDDFYKFCKLKRFYHKDMFGGVLRYNFATNEALIQWNKKFDCFLDNMMQLHLLNYMKSQDMMLPTFIERLAIEPASFLKTASVLSGNNEYLPKYFLSCYIFYHILSLLASQKILSIEQN